MKKRVYIDFDGVILDTWPFFYKILQEQNYELYHKSINNCLAPEDDKKVIKILNNLDWKYVLDNSPPINNSLKILKCLYDDGIFDNGGGVLTHCNSKYEAKCKRDIISKNVPGLDVIPVFRPMHKHDAVDPRGAVLVDDYGGNIKVWEQAGGIGVKFSTNINKKGNFYQIDSLDQIENIISQLEDESEKNSKYVKHIVRN